MWMEVGRVPADVQKFQIRDLHEDHEYNIRIYARNEIGSSEPLEFDETYKVSTKGKFFWTLNHKLCTHFFVTGYEDLPDDPKTERTDFSVSQNTSSWLREHNMDADISSYARAKLLRKDEYFFRLWHKSKKFNK